MVSPGPAAKLLRATVCFSIAHACPRDVYVKTSNDITCSCFAGNIRDFKIQRLEGNENVRKTIGAVTLAILPMGKWCWPMGKQFFCVVKLPRASFHSLRADPFISTLYAIRGPAAPQAKFPWIRKNEQKNYP